MSGNITVLELAKQILKTEDDSIASYVIWNWTGCPAFWNDSTITPEANLRISLEFYRDTNLCPDCMGVSRMYPLEDACNTCKNNGRIAKIEDNE